MPLLRASDGWPGAIGRAAQPHLARVGLNQTIDHFDQSRFACTILAQQRMNLARPNVEGHIVICDHARIGLGQAGKLQQGCGVCHLCGNPVLRETVP